MEGSETNSPLAPLITVALPRTTTGETNQIAPQAPTAATVIHRHHGLPYSKPANEHRYRLPLRAPDADSGILGLTGYDVPTIPNVTAGLLIGFFVTRAFTGAIT